MRSGWNRLRTKSKVGWFRVLKEDWICANRCCSDLGGLVNEPVYDIYYLFVIWILCVEALFAGFFIFEKRRKK